jgi:uncharacterized membrane protein (DUF4010 family)
LRAFRPVPVPPSGELTLTPVLSIAEFLPAIGLALAIGLLIGAERGWRLRDQQPGGRVAGIRTFALLGLLGGVVGIEATRPLATAALLIGAGAIGALLVAYALDMKRQGTVDATSAVAAMVTLVLAAAAGAGQMALASVGAGAATILLASRDALHRAIERSNEADLQALLRLVLVIFIILPLLPDIDVGPFSALNPRRLWLVVVVTAGIAFVGYALSRWLGESRGTLLVAAVGALVSSTAVTVNGARRIHEGALAAPNHTAISIAQTVMLARALVLVAILAPDALSGVAALLTPALLVSAVASGGLMLRSRFPETTATAATVKPPGLGLAFLFALTVAVLAVAAAWAQQQFGGAGAAIVIALGGTGDIDAAIAAVGSIPREVLRLEDAALALSAPILFNTLFKLVLLVSIVRTRAALMGSAALALSAAALAAGIVIELAGS